MQASKLNLEELQEKNVAWSEWSCFPLHNVDSQLHVHSLPGEVTVLRSTLGRRQAREGSVMLWASLIG